MAAQGWLKRWYDGLALNGCLAYCPASHPFVDLLRSFEFAYSYFVPLRHPPQTAPELKLQSSRVAWPAGYEQSGHKSSLFSAGLPPVQVLNRMQVLRINVAHENRLLSFAALRSAVFPREAHILGTQPKRCIAWRSVVSKVCRRVESRLWIREQPIPFSHISFTPCSLLLITCTETIPRMKTHMADFPVFL